MNGGGLEIFNDKEERLFMMMPWENGGNFVIFNNQGKLSCNISTSDLGSLFSLNDLLGKPKVGLEANSERGIITTYDGNGNLTGILGNNTEPK